MAGPGHHIKTALNNTAWLVGERLSTLLLNFVVAIFLARHFGPEAFGSLSYAIAFVALLSALPYLGLAGTVVQQLVLERGSQAEIMGTVIWAKLAAAILAVVLANTVAAFVVDEARARLLILIISFSLLFDVGTATRLMFEARTDLRQVAGLASGVAVLTATARLIAVALAAPLWLFAALVTIQSALAACGFLWLYRRNADDRLRLPFNWNRAKQLFRKSWPLILSSAAATAYLKIDQFMIGQMLGMAEVGTYAIAARLSEVWYFLPAAIATTLFPRLVELKASDPSQYQRRIKESLRYLFWLSLLIAVPVSFAAPTLVVILFGEPYRAAGIILAIHVWACPAVFMGMIIEKWFVTEDLLRFLIGRQLMSAAVNVGLNLVLIPRYGGAGAAVATVISYTLAYYLSCFTHPRTAQAGKWMTEAIFWPLLRLKSRQAAA